MTPASESCCTVGAAHRRTLGCAVPHPAALAAAPDTADDGKQEESTNDTAHWDGNVLVVLEPLLDPAPGARALADSGLALTLAGTVGAVEEVCVVDGASISASCAGYAANIIRTALDRGIANLAASKGSAALLGTRGALARCAMQSITASISIFKVAISWAVTRITGASLLRVALASAFATDGALG